MKFYFALLLITIIRFFLLTCRYMGSIHISGPPLSSWLAARMADLTPDLHVCLSVVDSRELPLAAIPLCHQFRWHLGPPRPARFIYLYPDLTPPLEGSTCPYQRILLSFRMRSRSLIPSCASSSLDLMVTMSCGLTLQICLIIALSFCCRCWRFAT